jgi:hypothetical protein
VTLITDFRPAFPPSAIAGLLLAARTQQADFGLPHPSVLQILEATGATRSRAYEVRDEILAQLPGLVRPPGRPRSSPDAEPVDDDHAGAVTRELLRFLMEHPGCVRSGSIRRRYSDVFRHRVLDLRREHADLDLAAFAEAVAVPVGTVEDWLRAGCAEPRQGSAGEPPNSPHPTEAPDARVAMIETVLHAWRSWHGDLTGFCEHVRHHHRLPIGKSMIARILFEHGERTPASRGRRHSDEDALRGSFETFFPGAQWVGDGKEVAVVLDGERLTYNLELNVDAYSGAWVGTSVRETEDAQAVIEAFEQGVETTSSPPIGLLLDNRPSNHTPEVDQALGSTLRIRSTAMRPQNKAHVEGAFGLFAQNMPELVFQTDDRAALGRQIVEVVAVLFARLLNRRPRRDRHHKSRAEIYQDPVAEEQREQARCALRERLRNQERARRTREARLDPTIRQIVDRAFEQLELADPERHVRNAIACYPLDHIVGGIAVFEGKRNRGTLPDEVDARYLLGIVRNLDHRHESDAITEALIRARLEARDILLQALVVERDEIMQCDVDTALLTLVDRALESDRAIDRSFWLQAAAELIGSRPPTDQPDLYREAARRIHATFAVPTRDRSAAVQNLARLVWPLS